MRIILYTSFGGYIDVTHLECWIVDEITKTLNDANIKYDFKYIHN